MTIGSVFASIAAMKPISASKPVTDAFPASILNCAQGGYIGNEFFALYTSNNYLIFRHVGESGVPLVRFMPWYKESNMKIVGMSFSYSAQYLVCVTTDLTIVVISVYFMMVKDKVDQQFKVISSVKYPGMTKFHFADLKCWRSSKGSDYAIITTTPGNVRIVNLLDGSFVKLKSKVSLGKIHIIAGPKRSQASTPSTFLLIESAGLGYQLLLLEQYTRHISNNDHSSNASNSDLPGKSDASSSSKQDEFTGDTEDLTSVSTHSKPEFQFTIVTSFPKSNQLKINVQYTLRGPTVLCFDPDAKTLSIFDEYLHLLFRYSINIPNPADVKVVHTTEKLIFVLTSSESLSCKLSVFSRLYSEEKDKRPPSPPLQEFILAHGADFRGSFSSFLEYMTHSTTPNQLESIAQASSSTSVTGVDTPKGSAKMRRSKLAASSDPDALPLYFDERREEDYDEDVVDESTLGGIFVWTEDALFELKPSTSPEELFFTSLEKADQKQSEKLGMTFALDVCRLYELAADFYFQQGNVGQAYELYHLSNVSTPKLIRQYLSVGRMDVPISKLRVMLKQGKMGDKRRPRVANELIRCHVQKLLSPNNSTSVKRLLNVIERCRDEDLEQFLKNNSDYQENQMRRLFSSFGLVRFDLIAAQSRGHLKVEMEQLAVRRGLSYLSSEHLRYLSENNTLTDTGALKVDEANTLLSHFPPNVQLIHYLAAISHLPNTLPRIMDLMFHEMNDESLSQICRLFDPQGEFLGPMLESTPQAGTATSTSLNDLPSPSSQSAVASHREFISSCVEVFISALVLLNSKCASLPQSWKLPSRSRKSSIVVKCNVTTDTTILASTSSNIHEDESKQSTNVVPPIALHSINASTNKHANESTKKPDQSHSTPLKVVSPLIDDEEYLEEPKGFSPRRPTSQDDVSTPSRAPNAESSNGVSNSIPTGPHTGKRGIRGTKAVSVSCGFHHTALITDSGQLFTWGAGSKGQLGHENVSETLRIPKEVSLLAHNVIGEKIALVACGGNHTIAVTQNGNIFSFGSNSRGQLGLGDRLDRFEPRLISFTDEKRSSMGHIVDISAGFWHSVFVTEKGMVMYAGGGYISSSSAATALHADNGDQLTFASVKNVPASLKFTKVRCGFGHTALLTTGGQVLTFGSNESGQLGHGNCTSTDSPSLVSGELGGRHIIDIACGSFSTFALTDVYGVYAWGLGHKWRLGILPPNERFFSAPAANSLSPNTASSSKSSKSSSSTPGKSQNNPDALLHSFVNLGAHSAESEPADPSDFMELSPVKIDTLQGKCAKLFAGPSHAFSIDPKGKLYVWGECSTPMKVVSSSDPESHLPAPITPWIDVPLVAMGCGDGFSIALTQNGLVYTFGSGICGQLGHNDQLDQPVAKQAFLNVSIIDESVERITNTTLSLLTDSGSGAITRSHSKSKEGFSSGSTPTIPSSSSASPSPTPSSGSQSHRRVPSFDADAPSIRRNPTSSGSLPDVEQAAKKAISPIQEEPSNRDSPYEAERSTLSTYQDPLLLEQSLISLFKLYRPAFILHLCNTVGNLAAASVILEQCGAWGASLDCKIKLLNSEFPKISSTAQQTHLLTELMKDLAQPQVPPLVRHEGLKQVLQLWKRVGGSVVVLEKILSSSPLLPTLASILESSISTNSQYAFFGLQFTKKFYLQIVQHGLTEQKKSAPRPPTVMLSESPLGKPGTRTNISAVSLQSTNPNALMNDPSWIERRNNMEKDLKQRTKIQISQPALEDYLQHSSAQQAATTAIVQLHQTDVVFTCGHFIPEQRFKQSILPQFKEKMAKFPIPLPLTTKLLVSDYHCATFNSACPYCVYNHLRERHAPSLEKWNPH